MAPKCSVVIRAYNEAKNIEKLLVGISQQTIKDVQIILVDSGSKDATLKIASRYPVEIVSISPNEFTFGRSLNFGISKAVADVIVIASAHVYPIYPDWLELLIAPFSNPRVALTYGKQRGTDKSRLSEQQIFAQWYPPHSDPDQKHVFCNNANAAIRHEVWTQQPFNENLPALEDIAWAKCASEKGHIISYVAEAEIVHVHNESWNQIYNRYRREAMAFKQIYPHEDFSLLNFCSLFPKNLWRDFQITRSNNLPFYSLFELISFRFMQFWGTYQGYRQSGPLTMQLKRTFYYPGSKIITDSNEVSREVTPITYESH